MLVSPFAIMAVRAAAPKLFPAVPRKARRFSMVGRSVMISSPGYGFRKIQKQAADVCPGSVFRCWKSGIRKRFSYRKKVLCARYIAVIASSLAGDSNFKYFQLFLIW